MSQRLSFRGSAVAVVLPIAAFLIFMVHGARSQSTNNDATASNAVQLVSQGRQIFRFDTFGDQAFWGDMLKLHLAIEGAGLGGVGPGVSPKTALSVGLKVDVDALPNDLLAHLKQGKINLDDPAVTLALLTEFRII